MGELLYELSYKQRELILCYADNNMNLQATARELGFSRGAIDRKLTQIKELTDRDPKNFYHLHELAKFCKEELFDELCGD